MGELWLLWADLSSSHLFRLDGSEGRDGSCIFSEASPPLEGDWASGTTAPMMPRRPGRKSASPVELFLVVMLM